MNTFLKQCKWGQFLLLQGDMICKYVDFYGEWGEVEVAMFRDLLHDSSNIIEVGANIGMHSIPFSRIASKGQVICFEPQRIIFQILSANCALNNRTNIFAEHLAVGNKTGHINISSSNYDQPWNYGAYSVVEGYNTEGLFTGKQWTEQVGITQIDEHPLAIALDSLRLLKIDVEGVEIEVLEGAENLISKHRPCIFVENNKSESGDALIQKIAALDYDSFWFVSKRFIPQNYNRETRDIGGEDVNMICFPAEQPYNPGSLIKVKEFADLKNGKVKYVTRDIYPAI